MERLSIWPWRRGAHEPKQRTRQEVEVRVYEILRREIEVKGFVLGPMTDLMEVTQRDFPEDMEWAIETLEKEFDMICPEIPDDKGECDALNFFCLNTSQFPN